MSFGKMNTFIDICKVNVTKDSDGFNTELLTKITTVRAYREGRHGSYRWANLAAFSEATDLFRFRKIPGKNITVDDVILCGNERFNITSVEDVKGRNMYIEVLAKKVVGAVGKV